MPVDAVLFDFGGVFTPSPFPVLREAAAELGIDPELAVTLAFGAYEQDTDHPWHRLERGEMSFTEARAQLSALAAEHEITMDAFALLGRIGSDDPDRAALVERVLKLRREGYRTALVTNNVAEFGEAWRRMIPVDEMFESVIDSSQVGIRKPDPRIYRLALDAVGGVPAERAVFLDDHPGNITAAAALGMKTVLVGPDRPAALAELDDILAA